MLTEAFLSKVEKEKTLDSVASLIRDGEFNPNEYNEADEETDEVSGSGNLVNGPCSFQNITDTTNSAQHNQANLSGVDYSDFTFDFQTHHIH